MKTNRIFWRDLLRQVRLLPILALFAALPLHAQVPSLINYQGRLTDSQGNHVTGSRTMAVRVYDSATGGNLTYQETIGPVEVSNGIYSFRFGAFGAGTTAASETIATTTGTNQIFSGTLQGVPLDGTLSLTDGTYSWTVSGGSSNPSAFGVTFNGTARSFQVVYWTQTPAAGTKIVASYQKTTIQTIDFALQGGEVYLALSVDGVEETSRTRLLAVPYALKSKESADTQVLRQELVGLGLIPPREGSVGSEFVFVQGGTLSGTTVGTFRIARYEVTWDEWGAVRTWATANGYTDLGSGAGSAGDHPVRNVSWYDVVKWCNARSEKEGLTPVYTVDGTVYRNGNFGYNSGPVLANSSTNGYRLPTLAEWDWAARGGVDSKNFAYSGGNDPNTVAWYGGNSGFGTRPVGKKLSNELGLYDMSGNVAEWCVDSDGNRRSVSGGSWSSNPLYLPYSYYADTSNRQSDLGFRLARSSGN